MCLSLGDVMNEIAGFEVDVCLRAERFVKDQDLDKATTKFSERSTVSAEQRDEIANPIYNTARMFWGFC